MYDFVMRPDGRFVLTAGHPMREMFPDIFCTATVTLGSKAKCRCSGELLLAGDQAIIALAKIAGRIVCVGAFLSAWHLQLTTLEGFAGELPPPWEDD